MSDKSNIEWTDATWNPTTGCTEVSPGCAHCYAKTFAERWRGVPGNYFEHGFDVQLRPNMLERPLHWTRPRRIFVNSMSDLFHEAVPDEYIREVFAVMWIAQRHTFQILTKRMERALEFLERYKGKDSLPGDVWPLPNVLIGPTIENQHFADVRLPVLAQIHELGWRTMVSYEPALGPVTFDWWVQCPNCHGSMTVEVPGGGSACPVCYLPDGQGWVPSVDWLICGGESGPKHRRFEDDWARGALHQAQNAGVPFFMKQLGGARPGTALEDLPEDLRVREFPS